MRLLMPTSLAVLSACQQFTPPAAYDALDLCIAKQDPGHLKVSANRARAILAKCEPELSDAARQSEERALGRQLDINRSDDVAEYQLRKNVLKEMKLTDLSDQIQPTFYRM